MEESNYINAQSWKSFLGIQAKNISYHGKFVTWEINKRRQVIKLKPLELEDLTFLKTLTPFSFFYFSKPEVQLLESLKKDGYEITAHKDPDIIIPISELNYSGKAYRDIRWSINKLSKMNLEVVDNFKTFDDVKKMLDTWGDTSAMKYFQDRSSKNKFFFSSNFHQDCSNTFIYDGENLIAFAILSPPDEFGNSSYIIGKSLCLVTRADGVSYSGLSEYADYLAYKKVQEIGGKFCNLGGGIKGTCVYKLKFPGAYKSDTYDGKVEIKNKK